MVRNIIFDFDGVILDSIPVKTEAFRKLFHGFPQEKIDQLIEFHLENGGMSRYKKIAYFFTKILNEDITKNVIMDYAKRYSAITKEELAQPKYLINDSVEFIKNNYKKYNMHIASGADEKDLRYICDKLNLNRYFLSIHGSPKIKSEIVHNILSINEYCQEETILVGDSLNDFYAANDNGITFYGYNNIELKYKNYLNTIKKLEFL